MKHRIVALLTLIATLTLGQAVQAKVTPSVMFTDNMVLQSGMQVPVWGTADPGEEVTVTFAGQKKTAKADTDGKWMIRLDPLKVSAEGRALTISGTELSNVLVGEVWIGSGQSNMAGSTSGYMKRDAVLAKLVQDGPYPNLRLYKGGWKTADEQAMKGFSAIHLSFGLHLYKELKVPVGLMVGAVGGTPSGRWLTREMADASPELMKMLKENSGYDCIDDMYTQAAEKRKEHEAAVAKAKAEGKKPPRFKGIIKIGDLYERNIQYMVPYGIRGVLWDQGESKTQIPGVDQITTMRALIEGWRDTWNQPAPSTDLKGPGRDFHFLHVQKPSGGGCAWDPDNPMNLNAVAFGPLPASPTTSPQGFKYPLDHIKMGTIKNAPLVTAVDLAPGIHPATKSAYGKRACRVAMGSVYGADVAICGPVYKSHKVEGNKLIVSFDHVGKGLAHKHGDKLQGFAIAGEDGKWEWADAVISGDTAVLSHANIEKPVAVQYGLGKKPNFANLFNKDGLPALMFCSGEK